MKVTILRDTDNARLVRHPDDLKLSYNSDNTIVPQGDETRDITKVPENGLYNEDDFDEEVIHPNNNPEVERTEGEMELIPRRSTRHRIPNQTIFNENFVQS